MEKYDIAIKENDIIFYDGANFEHDIFEIADNAPDCYELLALFSVYRFLFSDDITKSYFDR